jgi:hypothetical protein
MGTGHRFRSASTADVGRVAATDRGETGSRCHAADVNAQGGFYGNALQAASHGGHEKVVELLLGKGAVL